MAHRALAHRSTDDVAVAVSDLQPGEELVIESLDGGKAHRVKVLEAVPLGHKIALRDLPEGHVVIEYGEKVGRMTQSVKKGGYVHVHNVRTLRWDYGKGEDAERPASNVKSQKRTAVKPPQRPGDAGTQVKGRQAPGKAGTQVKPAGVKAKKGGR